MSKILKGGGAGGRLKQSNVRKMARGGMQRLPRGAQHSRMVDHYGLGFFHTPQGHCGINCPSGYTVWCPCSDVTQCVCDPPVPDDIGDPYDGFV